MFESDSVAPAVADADLQSKMELIVFWEQEGQLPQRYRAMCETVIQGHSRSSVVVPIDAAYMTS